MKKSIAVVILFIAALLSLNAQAGYSADVKNDAAAERIAKRAVSQLKKSAYVAKFAFVYYSADTESTEVNRGELWLDDLRFRVLMNGIETKYDGLTQWVYVADNNEVTITEPSREELVESNPMMMIEHYMSRHRVSMDNNQVSGADVVNFFPTNPKNCDFFKISFVIDTKTYLPRKMTIWQRSGDRISLEWDSFKAIEKDGLSFAFEASRYPGVVVNDMR